MAKNLKFCLCGHSPSISEKNGLFRVICKDCGRHGAKAFKKEVAKMVWNDMIEFLSCRRVTSKI